MVFGSSTLPRRDLPLPSFPVRSLIGYYPGPGTNSVPVVKGRFPLPKVIAGALFIIALFASRLYALGAGSLPAPSLPMLGLMHVPNLVDRLTRTEPSFAV